PARGIRNLPPAPCERRRRASRKEATKTGARPLRVQRTRQIYAAHHEIFGAMRLDANAGALFKQFDVDIRSSRKLTHGRWNHDEAIRLEDRAEDSRALWTGGSDDERTAFARREAALKIDARLDVSKRRRRPSGNAQ